MSKTKNATKPTHYAATITYTGKEKMHPEFGNIIEGLCGGPEVLDLTRLRRKDGETIHDTVARYLRREFEKAAKSSGYELDPKPFKIIVEID